MPINTHPIHSINKYLPSNRVSNKCKKKKEKQLQHMASLKFYYLLFMFRPNQILFIKYSLTLYNRIPFSIWYIICKCI